MGFVAAAVGTALVYAAWVAWVPLLPTNLYTPVLDLGQITGYMWTAGAGYLALVLTLFGLYALGYRSLVAGGRHPTAERSKSVKTAWLFIAAALFGAELLLAYPATAADVFGYVADGQLLALHHVNPLVAAPIDFPQDAIVGFLVYPGESSQYGPLWALLSGAMASLSGTELLQEVLLYKLVAVAAHLASGAVIYLIAARLTGSAAGARCSAYLFLWNPLLLWEMVGNAHDDGLMVLFGLVGIWLFVTGRDVWALASVSLGALVKLPIALIGPVLFVGVFRRGRTRAVEAALIGLALAVVVYLPFWAGPRTLGALQRSDLFTASVGAVLRLALLPVVGLDQASSLARTVSLMVFAVIAVLSVVFAFAAETDAERLQPAYWTLLGAVLFLTTWFQAWYVVWPFGVGAATGAPKRQLEVALLSLGGLLQYFVFIYLWPLAFPHTETLGIQLTAYLALVGPLGALFVWRLAQRVRLPMSERYSASSAEYH
jgi:alpha-1,6-mannosyltransferase